MEIVLRDRSAELCIDYQEGNLGFTFLDGKENQYDFGMTKEEWFQFKEFIDNSINRDESK